MDGDPSSLRSDVLRRYGERAVEAVASGASLNDALAELIRALEAESQVEMLGSILLLQGDRLYEGAAPNLPPAYNAAISGLQIGPAVGSCGTAAHYGETVFVDDIKTDPLWVDFRAIALEHGLRACWSTPIKDTQGRVLGTFANYYRQARHPRQSDYSAIETAAAYVAKAIEASLAQKPAV
jgi:GAF domain-containing protein